MGPCERALDLLARRPLTDIQPAINKCERPLPRYDVVMERALIHLATQPLKAT